MKIDYLKINDFGKISNKEINLKDNINVIYGKNESGKSTMLKFIPGMLYGVSKNKNGKDISDFDRYKPWGTENYSGKLKYTLDDGKSYEIYREFKKKNAVIYNDNLQDISKEFVIDKTKGIEFFLEQTGIEEELFKSTAIIAQEEVRLDKASQNSIVQKISNLVSSGDESISFKKTIDKINKEQNECVGTEKTSQRPINILKDKIEKIELEKDKLNFNLLKIGNITNNIVENKKNIEEEQSRLLLLKKIKENLEKDKLKEAEIDLNKDIEESYNLKIIELENKVDLNVRYNIKNEKKNFTLYYVLIISFIIIGIVFFILDLKIVFSIISFIISLSGIISLAISKSKFRSRKNSKLKEISELENKIKQEIEILKNTKQEQKNQISEKMKIINDSKIQDKEILKNEFFEKVDSEFLDMALEMNLDEVVVAINNKENRINTLKFTLNSQELELSNINGEIDKASKLEEELELLLEEKEELSSLNKSFNLAKECMALAYDKIRNNLSPRFMEKLTQIISKISNDKYSKINFNDEDGLTIGIEDGRYISAERLSTGTIDQMYLSLRLSTLQEISNEKIPIILDETFAYFDNTRLRNIIDFLSKEFKDNQIILFTCSNREMECLESLNISYNLITLEN